MKSSTRWKNLKRGMIDGLPICFGYFAVSFTIGILSKDTGLTAFQAFLLSITNLTSAGQFAGLGLIGAGAGYLEVACTQFVINMRYFLMSCSLSQKIEKKENPIHRFFMAYGVTDEIFGITACREGNINPWYFYGIVLVAAPGWGFGTLIGVLSGSILPESIINALGIAIYGMFIAVIIPAAKENRVVLGVILVTMLASYLFSVIPVINTVSSGFRIIILIFVIAGLAAWKFPISEKQEKEEAA